MNCELVMMLGSLLLFGDNTAQVGAPRLAVWPDEVEESERPSVQRTVISGRGVVWRRLRCHEVGGRADLCLRQRRLTTHQSQRLIDVGKCRPRLDRPGRESEVAGIHSSH